MDFSPSGTNVQLLRGFVTLLSLSIPVVGYAYGEIVYDTEACSVTVMLGCFGAAIISTLGGMIVLAAGPLGGPYENWRVGLLLGMALTLFGYLALGYVIYEQGGSRYRGLAS